MNPLSKLEKRIEQLKKSDCFRELSLESGLIDFCSNDYLGFSSSNEWLNYAEEHLEAASGLGAGASRLISGNFSIMEDTERYLAKFYNAESALVFGSGYAANTGLLPVILSRNDCVIFDELVHASIRDAITLSRAKPVKFKHNNIDDFKQKLELTKKDQSGSIVLVIESLYSMDGDLAPIGELLEICQRANIMLIVDEAHAAGVLGWEGKGLAFEFANHPFLLARVVTFGKAFSLHGACVLGSRLLRESLINFSRPFIYTTAPPEALFYQIKVVHKFLEKSAQFRQRLSSLSAYFNEQANNKGLSFIGAQSQIKAFVVPGNSQCKRIASVLQGSSFDVRAILSPTVTPGKERIRICLHAFNSQDQIDSLLEVYRNNRI